jgi:hypothetical protein
MCTWGRGRAVELAPFDLVVCNPPYMPHDPRVNNALPATIGPARAWNAGYGGRLVLDPLCEAVPDLLADRGSLLLVQSEFADPRRTFAALSSAGLDAEIVAWQWIPFGPVLTSRAWWLKRPIVSIPTGARRSCSSSGPTSHDRFGSSRGAGETQRPGDGAGSGAHRAARRQRGGIRSLHGGHLHMPAQPGISAVRHQPSAALPSARCVSSAVA